MPCFTKASQCSVCPGMPEICWKKKVAHLKFEMLAKTREKNLHNKKTKDKFEVPLKHTTAIRCVRIVNSVETTCLCDHELSNEWPLCCADKKINVSKAFQNWIQILPVPNKGPVIMMLNIQFLARAFGALKPKSATTVSTCTHGSDFRWVQKHHCNRRIQSCIVIIVFFSTWSGSRTPHFRAPHEKFSKNVVAKFDAYMEFQRDRWYESGITLKSI